MKQTTLTVDGAPVLKITGVGGDLQVVGWERPQVTAKADDEDLELVSDGQTIRAASHSDLILYIPRTTALKISNVGGDADLRAAVSGVEIASVGGDLQMRNIGAALVNSVGGDVSVRGCAGDCLLENVGGDASLHQIGGNVATKVGADLYLRSISGNISAQAGSDAALYLLPREGQLVNLQVGGDILLHIPGQANAELTLQGSDDESVRVDLPGVDPDAMGMFRQVTLGSGSAKINLTAGSEVIVTSREEAWDTVADFDPLGREGPFVPGEFPGISPDLQESISRRIEEATRRALKASMRAQEKSEHIQHRVDAAMRRAEQKMRAAENRGGVGVLFGGRRPVNVNFQTQNAALTQEPPSDDERLMILRMLQNKKISLDEAERLLATLEGK